MKILISSFKVSIANEKLMNMKDDLKRAEFIREMTGPETGLEFSGKRLVLANGYRFFESNVIVDPDYEDRVTWNYTTDFGWRCSIKNG